jgi:hypothetical protein
MLNFLKNIIKGFGTISIFPSRSNLEPYKKFYKPAKSDADALKSDWEKVSQDICKAIDKEIKK